MENSIVTLSVYYAREGWSMLIKKCIIPTIKSVGINEDNSNINVLLGLYGGNEQSCQLIIYGFSEQLTKTVELIEKKIEEFLNEYPSQESESYRFKPGEVLWMPHPNNSIKLHYTPPIESFFSYPKLLFYKQSITNLLMDWFNNNEETKFDEDEIYTFALFIQLILFKIIDYYKMPVDFQRLFFALEAKMDITNNMALYNEVITNSSDSYYENIDNINDYYLSIDFEKTDDKTLSSHYTTIKSILTDNAGNYIISDYLISRLMLAGYELLGIIGIKQLYVQNMLKLFYSDRLKTTSEQ